MKNFLIILCLTATFTSTSGFCQELVYSNEKLNFSTAVGSAWRPLTQCPRGYPIGNYLSGWKYQTGPQDHAVIVTTVWPIEVKGVDLSYLGKTAVDYFNSLGAGAEIIGNRQIGGKQAILVVATGIGDGMALGARVGNKPTKAAWAIVQVAPTLAIRIQLGAPSWAFEIVFDDYLATLNASRFDGTEAVSFASSINREAIAQGAQSVITQAQTSGVAVAKTPEARTASRSENQFLSSDQWEELEKLAAKRGISVGKLLREIVDDFLAKQENK